MPTVLDPEDQQDIVWSEIFRSIAAMERKMHALDARLDKLEAEWDKRHDRWHKRIEKVHRSQAVNDEITDGLARRVQQLEDRLTFSNWRTV